MAKIKVSRRQPRPAEVKPVTVEQPKPKVKEKKGDKE